MSAPTWVLFVCLAITSFAPVVLGLRPGPWTPYYYAALFVLWIWVSFAVVRRRTNRGQTTAYGFARSARPPWDTEEDEEAEAHAAAVRRVLAEDRLIIVARDDGELYDRLRRDPRVDEAVRIITDRRSAERRRQLEVYIPDRRGGERRRHDIDPLLNTQGWAEVTLPRGE
jgi:hypothetical protein